MKIFCAPFGTSVFGDEYPYVVLWDDDWDDYHFKTTFRAEIYIARNDVVDLGQLKILQKGLPATGGRTELPSEFDTLGSEYASLGQEYLYYETLRDLGSAIYEPLLIALRDMVYKPSLRTEFSSENGFEKSLLRGSSAVRVLDDAPRLFWHTVTEHPGSISEIAFEVSTRVGGSQFSIVFNFGDRKNIPNRINAVIGYNGVGKTRLLANLAMLASADQERQREYEFQARYGSFVGEPPRFGATIAVSYSAFDTFELPATSRPERSKIEQSGELQGYTYCGLRKLEDSEAHLDARSDERHVQFKSTTEITEDFFNALESAQRESRKAILRRALDALMLEPSFARAQVKNLLVDRENFDDLRQQLSTFSTGHKIVLNILVQLVAKLQRRSLVLIDEPESHLHPPLLAALLRSVSVALEERDSVAVIATHSPVVLQEIPRRYVRVLQRNGRRTEIDIPTEETFGENVGFLTRTVFNLDSSQTDYQRVLVSLANRFNIEEIVEMFDGKISAQARAQIIAQQRRHA